MFSIYRNIKCLSIIIHGFRPTIFILIENTWKFSQLNKHLEHVLPTGATQLTKWIDKRAWIIVRIQNIPSVQIQRTELIRRLMCLFRTFNFSDDSMNTIMLTIDVTDKGAPRCTELHELGLFLAAYCSESRLCALGLVSQIQFC